MGNYILVPNWFISTLEACNTSGETCTKRILKHSILGAYRKRCRSSGGFCHLANFLLTRITEHILELQSLSNGREGYPGLSNEINNNIFSKKKNQKESYQSSERHGREGRRHVQLWGLCFRQNWLKKNETTKQLTSIFDLTSQCCLQLTGKDMDFFHSTPGEFLDKW